MFCAISLLWEVLVAYADGVVGLKMQRGMHRLGIPLIIVLCLYGA